MKGRVDKALAGAAADAGVALSRSRIGQLIGAGAVRTGDGDVVAEVSAKVKPGAVFRLEIPPALDAEPQPEDIPLEVLHEDADLIAVNKPAGMVVHPAPGAETGTLVNALLHHCGPSLTGIGGEKRPGIVHRIDKDTSGVLVVAKSEAAMTGLGRLFHDHQIDREYKALAWGAPNRASPRLAGIDGVGFEPDGRIRIETLINRNPVDRKKMAVVEDGGRTAITYLRMAEAFGPAENPFASLLVCRLETGRTHQIRVHAAHIGHSLVGDATYGRPRRPARAAAEMALIEHLQNFPRQALHAAQLGFAHPVTGQNLHLSAEMPQDMKELLIQLRRNG
ncbi:MAG: RluA family pseudouridine synthase [Pseudomonadota bacterium]